MTSGATMLIGDTATSVSQRANSGTPTIAVNMMTTERPSRCTRSDALRAAGRTGGLGGSSVVVVMLRSSPAEARRAVELGLLPAAVSPAAVLAGRRPQPPDLCVILEIRRRTGIPLIALRDDVITYREHAGTQSARTRFPDYKHSLRVGACTYTDLALSGEMG